jgi:hypothetical protein
MAKITLAGVDALTESGGVVTLPAAIVVDAAALTGDLPAISGAALTNLAVDAANVSGVLPVGVTGGSGLEAVPGRYFYAFKNQSSNQPISPSTFTLCTFESVVQSHSSFSNANDYFTAVAADAGKWFFISQLSFYVNAGNLNNPLANIYHNNSNVMGGYKFIMSSTQTFRHVSVTTSGVLTIASGDTIKLYGQVGGSSPYFFGGDTQGIKGTSIVGMKL